tara:strand:+ start:1781 stop:3109 length:1329 start_codon:yes stop_codon:yes gene_type:complete
MITEFFITKLYDERNVRIKFSNPYKILVAENGYGKTTILNSFYALLSGEISKLRKISFEEIGVIFSNGETISFTKSEFDADLDLIRGNPLFEHIESKFGQEFILELLDDARRLPTHRLEMSPAFMKVEKELEFPSRILINELRISSRNNKKPQRKRVKTSAQDKLEKINEYLQLKTLYLPTYRRVEEDIRSFSSSSKNSFSENMSINFGMGDVQESIEKITSEILSSSVEWFSKINGEMLSQLVTGFLVTPEMKDSISDPKAVEIVLERIGKHISEPHKRQILDLVESGAIHNEHDPLIYFVSNLLKVYEQQQENDEAIQNFTKVCNKYLADKEIIYDESNVTIDIVRKKNKRTVDIESLSSGEKQIISLFALLYLQKKESLAIFFDEPELSLSMEWQKTLLPDIVNSGKCKFLFSTTHSPFIFDNELEDHTVDLFEYIEEL